MLRHDSETVFIQTCGAARRRGGGLDCPGFVAREAGANRPRRPTGKQDHRPEEAKLGGVVIPSQGVRHSLVSASFVFLVAVLAPLGRWEAPMSGCNPL